MDVRLVFATEELGQSGISVLLVGLIQRLDLQHAER